MADPLRINNRGEKEEREEGEERRKDYKREEEGRGWKERGR